MRSSALMKNRASWDAGVFSVGSVPILSEIWILQFHEKRIEEPGNLPVESVSGYHSLKADILKWNQQKRIRLLVTFGKLFFFIYVRLTRFITMIVQRNIRMSIHPFSGSFAICGGRIVVSSLPESSLMRSEYSRHI
jgi:hypothetical protein